MIWVERTRRCPNWKSKRGCWSGSLRDHSFERAEDAHPSPEKGKQRPRRFVHACALDPKVFLLRSSKRSSSAPTVQVRHQPQSTWAGPNCRPNSTPPRALLPPHPTNAARGQVHFLGVPSVQRASLSTPLLGSPSRKPDFSATLLTIFCLGAGSGGHKLCPAPPRRGHFIMSPWEAPVPLVSVGL